MALFADITASPYNAKGDGTGGQDFNIQKALDAVGNASPTKGGVVYCPPASEYYSCSGPLLVHPDVELRLAKGAFLRKEYPAGGLITDAFIQNADFGTKVDRFAITGEG